MKKTLNKGFTLIELLVVIAIIGILSGIVLTSLGTARNKAKSASATASLSSMRSQAELGVNNSGQYVADICNSSATGGLSTLLVAVNDQAGTGKATCAQNPVNGAGVLPTAWAATVDLTGISGTYFCVDSTGAATSRATAFSITTPNLGSCN